MNELDILQNKLQFPLTAYVKENGFLGLVSYNSYEDDLLIATKSSLGGDFQMWFKDMIYKKISSENIEKLKSYVKDNNVTFLFECVDVEHDPHIIEYPESELFLLDIVANNLEFSHVSYTTLTNLANRFGLKVKTLAYELSNWQEFYDWYQMVNDSEYQYDGKYIEGFVVEDSANYMFKVKGSYYSFWKMMRGVAAEVFRKGYIDNTGKLYNAESNYFYDFLRKLYNETAPEDRENLPRDVITLRRMYSSLGFMNNGN